MATQLQLRRGTTSENGSFTGALGEVTVDTDKDTLVVHDGATAGGHEMAKKDGSNMTAIDVGDNVRLKMGNDDDLLVYHDGSNSRVQDSGTGSLLLRGTNLKLQDSDGYDYVACEDGGGEGGTVKLKHNNQQVLATTSSGVSVTGDISNASGDLTLDVAGSINLDADGGEFRFKDGGTLYATAYQGGGGSFYLATAVQDKDLIFQGNDGGSTITMLTLDASAAGAATFNSNVNALNVTAATNGTVSAQYFGNSSDTNTLIQFAGSDDIRMRTGGVEGMRINSSQDVSIPNGQLSLTQPAVQDIANTIIKNAYSTGSNHATAIQFRNAANSEVGTIKVSATATAYNTSSDYRLKEDVQAMSGATDRLKELKPVNFAWKADGSRVDGFLAHEAQAVVPESVSGSKDGMKTEEYEVSPAVYEDVVIPAVEAVEAEYDEEGNVVVEAVEAQEERTENQLVTEAVMDEREVPDYQGIDQSKLVPLLVATIQELEARITALEA